MSDWTSGYVSEIDYTHGYYPELSPVMLQMATANKLVATRSGKPLRYLELGFGQGLSLNIHAAACPGEYWGTDFNPAQAANAREIAEASGTGAHILDLSFAELAEREDLPEFDIIALHGIWSWISDENRAVIVDLVRRKLVVGGMVYISYNCTPGWSPAMPLRHLMMLHSELAGSEDKGITSRIDGALDFAQQVADAGAIYFRANPALAERLKSIKGQNRQYLAHEYFNRDWEPMPFSRVAELLAQGKVEFAAGANLVDHIDAVSLTADGQTLLASISHPILRESVRDYLLSQQFRKDIFVKGARAIAPGDQAERFCAQEFVLTSMPMDIKFKLKTAVGEFDLQQEIYQALIDVLAENRFASKTVTQLLASPQWGGRPQAQLMQALIILAGKGDIHPTQPAAMVEVARPRCKALNAYLCNRARFGSDIAYLASPLIGGGIMVGRFEQLFLLARQADHAGPVEWANYAWALLSAQGQRLLKDGQPIASPEDNLAELRTKAQSFADRRLELLEALEVA